MFPGHSRDGGELLIGGTRVCELAAAYGTPLLLLDYGVLDEAISGFTGACQAHGIEISYAAKAFFVTALARHLKHTALNVDVCSLGELATAEAAGFPAERITLHGCGKTVEEIDAVREGRVGRIVVDNLDELQTLREAHDAINVLLRINTGIEAHTHEFVRTSGENSKFGFDPAALPAALDALHGAPHLRFRGLHSHIGSQIYEQAAFEANAQALMECASACAQRGFETAQLVVGGGFGVPMRPGANESLDIASIAAAIARTVREEAQRRSLPVPQIGIEPGRALIAAAGTSLYRVMAAKRQFGRPYVIVDGGIYENPRPALYDAYHHAVCASRESDENVETVICGRTCENDRLGSAMLPANISAGDLVAMCTTGAYTRSMASNYNRFTRPAVAAVRQGTHSLIARRETIDDVLRTDLDV
jgi:diaminopimelate decarboxylase